MPVQQGHCAERRSTQGLLLWLKRRGHSLPTPPYLYAQYWSVANNAPNAFAQQLVAIGYAGVSCAATHHCVQQLMPSASRGHMFFADHSYAYFLPRSRGGHIIWVQVPNLDCGLPQH